MRLEDVSAQIRPRAPWESVDLGFALTRRHFPKILAAWCLTVVPVWILLLLAGTWISHGWSLFFIWLLKPIYDRVPLYYLSRSLFGAPPRVRDIVHAWPRMLVSRSLWLLIFRIPWLIIIPAFGWARALLLPVLDLEGQRGKQLRERQQVLLRMSGGTAGWLIVVCAVFETILVFALLTLAGSMATDPTGAFRMGEEFLDAIFRKGQMAPWLQWSLTAGYLVAMTFVEIFYVGGAFGIYLNCRTHLEGWDVEIAFRKLARRLGTAAVALATLALLIHPASAVEVEKTTGTREGKVMQEVLKHPDFEIHKLKGHNWEPTWKGGGGGGNWSFDWLSGLGTTLYYLTIAAIILGLIWVIYKNRDMFTRRPSTPGPERTGPRVLMGMDITPESLPDDIAAAALALWQRGDARGALSLLYRGALSSLIHNARLPVRDGDTEGDCLRHTRQLPQRDHADYFEILTAQWITVAYGERPPEPGKMERILQTWPFRAGGGQ